MKACCAAFVVGLVFSLCGIPLIIAFPIGIGVAWLVDKVEGGVGPLGMGLVRRDAGTPMDPCTPPWLPEALSGRRPRGCMPTAA